jgi:hypothetical protein
LVWFVLSLGERAWEILKLVDIPSCPPFYAQSKFGYFALLLCNEYRVVLTDSVSAKILPEVSFDDWDYDDAMGSAAIQNPHYNVEYLSYLLRNIFPISALLNHSLLCLNNFSIDPDTNGVRESWNKTVKIDEMPKALPMRLTRFLTEEEKGIHGN